MRKCLLFVALLLVSQINNLHAQYLFESPDTVCIKQPIKLTSNTPSAASHYWGFCSGYLFNTPTGSKLGGDTMNIKGPTAIEVTKHKGNYYAFVANNRSKSFTRLAFGNSLSNVPVATNFGSIGGALPEDIYSLYVVNDEAADKLYVFVGGGTGLGNSVLARIDFDNSFDNVPNIVNFGNLGNLVAGPRGLFVEKEGNNWFGFFVNYEDGNLIKMEFGDNVSLTPSLTSMGCFPDPSCQILSPTDMAVLRENGTWTFYIVNERNSYLGFLFVGPSLEAATTATMKYVSAGNPGATPPPESLDGLLSLPSAVSVFKDCDSIHLFFTNKGDGDLIRYDLKTYEGSTKRPVNLGNIGGLLSPTGMSRLIRDRDNIYMLVSNFGDSSFTRIEFNQCKDANITSATTWRPPTYKYNKPGYYNVYYAINEGLPTMQVQCRQIAALQIPQMTVSNDTLICQGDSINLTAFSVRALTTTWSPNYNLSSISAPRVTVWPEYTQTYNIVMPFANGCIVDTPIEVKVRKIKADAGPDRTLRDGAGTVLGGPLTSLGTQYSYKWFPNQYIDDAFSLNPVARPPYDFNYYLQLIDTAGCVSTDTVKVYVQCNGINLPNAFVPGGQSAQNSKFGILNSNVVKLNYFHIYDRWGKQVFTTTDPLKHWDGNINMQQAPMGVYTWVADGFCANGERIQAQGNVTLIR